jgi:GTP cyclohydrolase I
MLFEVALEAHLRWAVAMAASVRSAERCVQRVLSGLGESPDREGLRDTPKARDDNRSLRALGGCSAWKRR